MNNREAMIAFLVWYGMTNENAERLLDKVTHDIVADALSEGFHNEVPEPKEPTE